MYIPFIYELSHYIFGAISVKYNFIIVIFLIYQFLQLIFNVRIFMLDFKIKKGNNLKHTINKISQFFLGYIIAYCIIILFNYLKKYYSERY